MKIVKKNHLPSGLLTTVVLSIMLFISANVRASTSPGTAGNTSEKVSITQACVNCVSYGVSVWKFTPTRPDALRTILQSLNALPDGDAGNLEGQRVISAAQTSGAADMFRKSGALEPLVLWNSVSVFREFVPLELTSSSGTFSAVLKLDLGEVSLSQKLVNIGADKANQIAPNYPALLSFQLKADQSDNTGSGVNSLASGGRVLLQNGGALLNINRQGKSYIIWLVHTTYPNI